MMFFGFLIVIFAVVFFLKPDILKSRMTISSSYDKEMRILRERLANGEISIEQYEVLKKALYEEK
ncbi:SHOCT domain-containing protein [Mesotoga sp.]|uniref:SHOCT domain-containing protein n=1 Tax=Mesotoga sp. TaxID=2053577 RepID=UPI000AC80175